MSLISNIQDRATDAIGELDAYVQALADLPGQEGFPGNVRWPEVPA